MPKKKEDTDEASIGHNSGISAAKLKSYIARIEKLNEDKAAITEDLRVVYSEAKSEGFSAPTIRAVIRERAMDVEKRREQEELLEIYRRAVGLIDG